MATNIKWGMEEWGLFGRKAAAKMDFDKAVPEGEEPSDWPREELREKYDRVVAAAADRRAAGMQEDYPQD